MLKKFGKWYLYAIGGFFVIAIIAKGLGLGGTPESAFEGYMKNENIAEMERMSKSNPNLMIDGKSAEEIITELKAKKKAESERLAKEEEAKKRAEAEKLAQEAAAKKAETERLAKEEEAKKKSEAERLAKEEEAKKAEVEKLEAKLKTFTSKWEKVGLKGTPTEKDFKKYNTLKESIDIIEAIELKTEFTTFNFVVKKTYVDPNYKDAFFYTLEQMNNGQKLWITYPLNQIKEVVSNDKTVNIFGSITKNHFKNRIESQQKLYFQSEKVAKKFTSALKTLYLTDKKYFKLLTNEEEAAKKAEAERLAKKYIIKHSDFFVCKERGNLHTTMLYTINQNDKKLEQKTLSLLDNKECWYVNAKNAYMEITDNLKKVTVDGTSMYTETIVKGNLVMNDMRYRDMYIATGDLK